MKTNCKEKGFSLVELMVALAILAVGMSAVGAMLLSSFQSDRHNRNVRRAETVLRYICEQFAGGNLGVTGATPTPYDTSGSCVVRGNSIITDTTDANPGTFYCSWTSSPYTTSNLNQLDLVIGWGATRSSSKPCNRANPDNCPYVIRMTNFYTKTSP